MKNHNTCGYNCGFQIKRYSILPRHNGKFFLNMIITSLFAVLVILPIDRGIAQWQSVALPIPGPLYHPRAVYFPNPDTGFIAGQGIIMKTADEGLTWQLVIKDSLSPQELRVFEDVYFPTASTGLACGRFYSSNNGILLRSTDSGDSWISLSIPTVQTLQNFFFLDSLLGYATAYGQAILKTSDGGENWSILFDGPGPLYLNIFMLDSLTGYGNYGDEIWKTTNGGTQWTTIATLQFAYKPFFINSDTGFVGFSEAGETGVYKSTDGGQNWQYTMLGSGGGLTSIQFTTPQTGYVGSHIGIFKTTNGGLSWAQDLYNANIADIFFPNPATGYAISQDSLYRKSEIAAIGSHPESPVNGYHLYPNYPNPFNPSTEIRYSIPRSEKVTITIYNILGQKIKTLISRSQIGGDHRVIWDGTNNSGHEVSSGIYFYQLQAGEFREVKKAILMR